MKTFNREIATQISERVQEVLSEYFRSGDFEYAIKGGSFSADTLKLNLVVRIKNEDGSTVVSDTRHKVADTAAASWGLSLAGHFIGSMWNIKGIMYTVEDYITKRRAYPVSLRRADGKMSKSSVSFLKQGTQIVVPTEEDFVKWFTMDPDSDAILESDATICDRVQAFLDFSYPVEDGDAFYELVDKFNDAGIAKRWAKRAYELLFKDGSSMKTAYLGMKVIYDDYEPKKKK